MPISTLSIETNEGRSATTATALTSRPAKESVREFINLAKKALAGGFRVRGKYRLGSAAASGTLTLSSADGAVGGVINGTTVTATAAGGDTASAALIAAAINANASVKDIVTASSSGAVVTVTCTHAGVVGNCVTFVASGTGVTASGSGKLAGGTTRSVAV